MRRSLTPAKKCGCHEFIMGLENGYQTVCGASGGHLSGGERQRHLHCPCHAEGRADRHSRRGNVLYRPGKRGGHPVGTGKAGAGARRCWSLPTGCPPLRTPIRSLLSIKARSKRPARRRSFLRPAPFIKPCGRPTSASKTTGRWRNAQDTEKIFCLLRGGQPQAVYNIYLAGRGQRHLLCHAYSGSRHRHSGAAAKECHRGDALDRASASSWFL